MSHDKNNKEKGDWIRKRKNWHRMSKVGNNMSHIERKKHRYGKWNDFIEQ
jgi:hypothetical protein